PPATEEFAIDVTAVNDPPTVALGGAGGEEVATFTEGGGAVPVCGDDALTVSDVDDFELESAGVWLGNSLDFWQEWLSVDVGDTGISASFDFMFLSLRLTGTASVLEYQTVLRSLTYDNNSQSPTPGARSLFLRVNDGEADSDVLTLTVTVAEKEAPLITGQRALSTPEEAAIALTLADLYVTDPDSIYPDEFMLTVLGGTNYTRNGATITPVVDFNGQLSVPVSVSDGTAESNVFDLTITVMPVPDAPVITGQDVLVTSEDTALTISLDDLHVTDPDSIYPDEFMLTVLG
ncbi:MAG: hypothetical protein HN341_11660, partial [Verrucomicrobia bacterium]|nr:hypothetical protein [Verrucomicrobiota bacterium]